MSTIQNINGEQFMFNFFVDELSRTDDSFFITGSDFNHIKNVLRMKTGDTFSVNCGGKNYLCELVEYKDNGVFAQIKEKDFWDGESPIKIYLFQGLPKNDKMELIIQKAVELGVYSIIPTEMEHCVVRLDDKKKTSKVERWQLISENAAKQSKRNIVPEIQNVCSFKSALEFAKTLDVILVPYENEDGMASTKSALSLIKNGMSVGIFIGAEGGFSKSEIEMAKESGGKTISLGKRILRTETAAMTATAMCMLYAEMELN